MFARDGYVGTGISLWDFNHGDQVTGGLLIGFGIPVWRDPVSSHSLLFAAEGRLLFDRIQWAPASNYQIWGGLRYLFR